MPGSDGIRASFSGESPHFSWPAPGAESYKGGFMLSSAVDIVTDILGFGAYWISEAARFLGPFIHPMF